MYVILPLITTTTVWHMAFLQFYILTCCVRHVARIINPREPFTMSLSNTIVLKIGCLSLHILLYIINSDIKHSIKGILFVYSITPSLVLWIASYYVGHPLYPLSKISHLWSMVNYVCQLYDVLVRTDICHTCQARSPPWLYHLFVDPICSFVTSQLKIARKHTSQPDYLRIFSQLVHELAGRLTVLHLNQLAVNYYFNNPQYPNIYFLIFSSLFLLHITFEMTCYMWP